MTAKATVTNEGQNKTFEFEGEVYTVKAKFQMFKFMRLIGSSPVEAIAIALTPDSLAKLDEIDMDMDTFKLLLENISDAISGTDLKN